MTIADEITREVVFTDYNCSESVRPAVCVQIAHGRPVATITRQLPEEVAEPDVLRAFAACLNAAADEMERMK